MSLRLLGLILVYGAVNVTLAAVFDVLERSDESTAYRVSGEGLPDSGVWVDASPGDFANDYVGKRVTATIAEREDGSQLLTGVFPFDEADATVMRRKNSDLRRDTVERGRRVMRNRGDYVPPFGLWNEMGEVTTPESWRGRYIVLNFIFTRCPTPEMCPAQTMRMARLQRSVNDAGWSEQVEFVSFTLDPEYDTPGILREYAETRGLDLDNFSLLTGPARAMDDLYRQFGIIAFAADGTIEHTVSTFVISPMGKIIHRKDGSRWSAKEFEDVLRERIENQETAS